MRRGLVLPLALAGAALSALACGGGGGGSGSESPPPVVATPSFDPPSAVYPTPQSVSIATATASAVIHYTTDGSPPTSASAVFVDPLAVDTRTTVRAIAVRAGYASSAIATAEYDIGDAPAAAAPAFAPAGGYYASPQSVALSSATPGATIRYTTDGSAPGGGSAVYAGPVAVSAPTTLRAIATAPAYAPSAVASASYVVYDPGLSGTPDPGFAASGVLAADVGSANESANAVVVQPDGKIVVAGMTVGVGSFFDFAVLRLNPDGSRDTSFAGGGATTTSLSALSDVANAVALQADGKIVVAGQAQTEVGLARYGADGALDPTFGSGGTVKIALGIARSTASSLAILDDGSILVGGWVDDNQGASNDFMAARFTPDGSLDPTFGTSGVAIIPFGAHQDEAYALAVQPDGKIVLAGCTTPGLFTGKNVALVRLEADGALDASFGPGGKVTTEFTAQDDCARAVAVLPDGRILAGGWAMVNVPVVKGENYALARYTSGGALDATFGTGGTVTTDFGSPNLLLTDQGFGMAVQPDGKIVLAGTAWSVDLGVARYQADGSLDGSFGAGGLVRRDFWAPTNDFLGDAARAVAIQPDGGIVVVGAGETEWNFGSGSDWVILRYLP